MNSSVLMATVALRRDNVGKPAARQDFYSRFGVTILE